MTCKYCGEEITESQIDARAANEKVHFACVPAAKSGEGGGGIEVEVGEDDII